MPKQTTDVLFYVQHLLGIGHLHRACILARAMDRAGLRVVFVSGGMPLPDSDVGGCEFVQLPPLRTLDESFSALVDETGRELDAQSKAERRDLLLDLLQSRQPRVLLFEMFPFGRRQMRFELLPLLEAAKASAAPPKIVCSLRDILTTHKKPGKTEWILDIVARYFDLILVHGDPDFVPLERSFPAIDSFRDKIRYTGYVIENRGAAPGPSSRHNGEVIVSAGGGAVAAPLIEAALAARPMTSLAEVPWRILSGPNLPEETFARLRRKCSRGVILEPARPDFTELLAQARLSISQAGYNTIMDVLATRVPAILVPFSATQQTEQALRAELLAERGAATVVTENQLSPATLAAAIEQAMAQAGGSSTQPDLIHSLDMAGAERTAALIHNAARDIRNDASS
jgi:predicted glycosyltransferase